MRIEILVLAALAALASAAPQWPYRDAVAPYYYGYPGKTPYMYRSGDEDDEMDESYLARQDLKVAAPKDAAAAGSSVTVIEDDEKADGIRVVETGSAKPVAQSGNNNIRQQTQQQEQAAAAPAASTQPQAQQPLSNNNPNNAQPANANNGQPLTVQQPGQQPPAFPPARPTGRPRPPVEEEEDEDEEEDDSEEDEEDAEDEEDGDDDDEDEEDEEDDEDRRRNDKIVQPASGSGSESEEPQQLPIVQEQQQSPQFSIVNNNSEGSDEVAQEEEQPVVVQPLSQSAVLNNKVNKNKQKNVAPVVVPNAGNRKKVNPAAVAIGSNKNNKNPGAIEALVPGYVTDQGEVLVPVDTVTGSQPITIVPDPFSPPSRIVSGPRPIPQSAVPSNPSRQVPYWYRSSPAVSPFNQEAAPRQTLYSAVPPPGSIFTFDDDDDDDEDTPSVIPGNRLRQEDDDDEQDEESEEDEVKVQPKPQKVPLAAVPASGNSGEDDEAEALAFVNSGRPISANKRPVANAATGGNKKPAAGTTQGPSSNESESEEDIESEEDEVSQEEEEEEDDTARRVILQSNNNKGRMYVDEDYVSFPPSRSPTLFAVIQGGFPGQRQQQSQVISSPSPYNPNQRYVVRVTPANRPRPQPQQPLFYRPVQSSSSPNRRVVPVASFDVSVEDTGPQSGPSAYYPGVDSDEEGESVIASGGPTPVSSYPFVYKVQGSLQGLRLPGQGGPRPAGNRPSRPSRPSGAYAYFGGPGGPGGPSRPPRPSYNPYSSPYASIAASLFGPYGPNGPSFSGPSGFSGPNGPRRPPSGGPPVIVRRKQPGGGPNRPPKPQLIAVYNPTGSSSSGPGPQRPRPREPVEEEYYTFEVPETNHKLVPGRPPSNNKRPTVHRKPTPVIHQKLVNEDEEESDEIAPGGPPSPQHTIQIIPQGTVRRRGAKQLKPKKKSSKKNSSSTKKQPQQDQQDPLGLLSKINKSTKSKFH